MSFEHQRRWGEMPPIMRLLEDGGERLAAMRDYTARCVRNAVEDGWNGLCSNFSAMKENVAAAAGNVANVANNMGTMAGTVGEVVAGFARDRVREMMEVSFPSLKKPDTPICDQGVERIAGKRVVVWLVHPTNYRPDGTPRKYKRQTLPSNAIGQLRAMIPKKLLDGSDKGMPVECHFLEDTVQPFDIDEIARSMEGEGVRGVMILCGIQSNAWPRAMDLASLCRDRNIPVIAGGYHMRAELPLTAKQAREIGISLAIGEAEAATTDGRPMMEAILLDLCRGEMKAEYRQAKNPDISGTALPEISPAYQQILYNPTSTALETSRGCPLPCSFCSVRTIAGREMRSRNPEQMSSWLKHAYTVEGIRSLFLTDDNFPRNKQKFEILAMFERLRREGFPINLLIQADTKATEGENGKRFLEACRHAGVYSVFIGVESVDPATLKAMGKQHNNPAQYAKMVADWHSINAIVQCGIIIGSEQDTYGVGARSAQALLDMGIDIATPFILTPLPGSVDYHRFHRDGMIIEPDLNLYDSHSAACLQFPGGLTPQDVEREYADFYREFYAFPNLPRITARLSGESLRAATRQWLWYKLAILRGDHPMCSGLGLVEPDFRRSDFPNRIPAEVNALAPRHDGPGSQEREQKTRAGIPHLQVIASP
jgi:tRNA A37 methylthiotransferase MiaB